MVVKFLLFLAYLVFAGYILYGEIGLNSYGAKQGALNRIDQAEKIEIETRLSSPEVVAQLTAYKERIANLNANNETKNELNAAAIRERGARVNPFDESLIATDSRVNDIQQEQSKFIAGLTSDTHQRYQERRDAVKGDASLISLGFAMPCAALFLCLFSAWVYPQGTLFKNNLALQSSFLAQGMSCIITFDAVMIQQGVWFKALALSVGAFVAIPTGHYFAGLLWQQIQAEWHSRKQRKAIEPPKAKLEQHEYTEEESLTHRRTVRGSKIEIEAPVAFEPKTYEQACQMKKLGKLQMSVREIADKFNVKKWQVEAALKTDYALPSPSDRDVPETDRTVS